MKLSLARDEAELVQDAIDDVEGARGMRQNGSGEKCIKRLGFDQVSGASRHVANSEDVAKRPAPAMSPRVAAGWNCLVVFGQILWSLKL